MSYKSKGQVKIIPYTGYIISDVLTNLNQLINEKVMKIKNRNEKFDLVCQVHMQGQGHVRIAKYVGLVCANISQIHI